MDAFLIIVGAVIALPALFIFGILMSTLSGALVGWVVGMFFSDTLLGIFALLGIKGFAMWQIGAFLGFVGAFFRTSIPTPKTSND